MEIFGGDEQLLPTLPDSQEHQSGLGGVAWDAFASSSFLYGLGSALKI